MEASRASLDDLGEPGDRPGELLEVRIVHLMADDRVPEPTKGGGGRKP